MKSLQVALAVVWLTVLLTGTHMPVDATLETGGAFFTVVEFLFKLLEMRLQQRRRAAGIAVALQWHVNGSGSCILAVK